VQFNLHHKLYFLQVPGHQTTFINELKLSDFKQVLNRSNISSEFSGGVLWCCNNTIAVRRVCFICHISKNDFLFTLNMHFVLYSLKFFSPFKYMKCKKIHDNFDTKYCNWTNNYCVYFSMRLGK